MQNIKKTFKINIVDILIIIVIALLAAFFIFRAASGITAANSINNSVEITFSVNTNIEYASNIAIGESIYLDGCSKQLGTVSDVFVSEDLSAATIKINSYFPYDADVYTLDGNLIARGKSYDIRTVAFFANASIVGITQTSNITVIESEEQ